MSPLVLHRRKIEEAIADTDIIAAIEDAFVAYSNGETIVPPVGELTFQRPRGEAHIKFGYRIGDDNFVVKIATGFYENPARGLPPFSGMMVAFSTETGLPSAILLDEGILTNLRTAAAIAVAVKWLAPHTVNRIAILGAGVQAKLQLEFLSKVTACRGLSIWARRHEAAEELVQNARQRGFDAIAVPSAGAAAAAADIVITVTASEDPLIGAADIKPDALVVAAGSDTPAKQELQPEVLEAASMIVTDSRKQCVARGEIHHALTLRRVTEGRILELGEVISSGATAIRKGGGIAVVDLTGVAIQDIAMVNAVLAAQRG